MSADKHNWIELTPDLGDVHKDFIEFCRRIEQEQLSNYGDTRDIILQQLKKAVVTGTEPLQFKYLCLLFANSVVLDLAAHDWKVLVDDTVVRVRPPSSQEEVYYSPKNAVRARHLLGRDAYLRESTVVDFVRGMKRRKLTRSGWHSIYSLMRDGQDLSEKLGRIVAVDDQAQRLSALAETISPYLQFVESESVCDYTGLRLADVWRYFRLTWVNEHKSQPGRSVMILVRDAASRNHPVIGIAALGSSVIQSRVRDEWIRWEPVTFFRELVPSKETAKWLITTLQSLISEIYIDDLCKEGICKKSEIEQPTTQVITRLKAEAVSALTLHHRTPQRPTHSTRQSDFDEEGYWTGHARTHLFRRKRCQQLAKLLWIRQIFQSRGLISGTRAALKRAVSSVEVRSAIEKLIRVKKAEHVGSRMMDITVCGAIAPYNSLLGGKLVCMLLCSPEVTHYYRRKYSGQVSQIASSMKGEPVVRDTNLVLLCTTSLYGVGSSQYNRVKIPAESVGGRGQDEVAYKKLGYSCGFGTYHFSRETQDLADTLLARRDSGRRVNSIFGEGVNPLMRKMREALKLIRLPGEELLLHGDRRLTYGVALASNFRQVLLGVDKEPRYLIPQTDAARRTEMLVDSWRRRWLSPRISRDGILDEVSTHRLTHPITHGATVPDAADDSEMNFQQTLW
jgi:hypothetical protein